MAPTIYADVLRRNIRALRVRAGLHQGLVVERMRALGYTSWHRQTMGNVERGERRVMAEEIFGLAVALQTTIAALMSPVLDDRVVEFPSGQPVSVWSVQQLLHGMNVGLVAWKENGAEPVFFTVEAANMAEAELRRRTIESEQQQPVIAAIVTSDRGVLVTRRRDRTPPWGFVTGWSEPGESPADTIIREAKEEAGLRVKVGDYIDERDHPDTGRHMIYYAAKPAGSAEIHLGDEAELLEVRWVSLAEADELLPGMFGPVREHLERVLGAGGKS
jgi:8-oxo-dGTP pyrophosphatase MutT (NUDIX family)